MVRYVRDPTGRLEQRPYWLEAELDKECERLVLAFLRRLHGKVDYPISKWAPSRFRPMRRASGCSA